MKAFLQSPRPLPYWRGNHLGRVYIFATRSTGDNLGELAHFCNTTKTNGLPPPVDNVVHSISKAMVHSRVKSIHPGLTSLATSKLPMTIRL